MNRGDRQEPIFGDDRDRQRFLETLTEACEKTGWQVHAFCLMSNHFHLVVETPQPNLVAGMKWFLGAYTSRYNRRHKEFGHEGVSQRECNILLTADRAGGYGEPMARKLRIQYPGAIYHVMNRGDRQEPIFGDDRDRQRFLETLTEACEKTGWQVHAFCLMSNHFHLVVETPQPNLVAGMKWFLGTYTAAATGGTRNSGISRPVGRGGCWWTGEGVAKAGRCVSTCVRGGGGDGRAGGGGGFGILPGEVTATWGGRWRVRWCLGGGGLLGKWDYQGKGPGEGGHFRGGGKGLGGGGGRSN